MGDQHGAVADADVARHADDGVPDRGVQPVESLQLAAPRDEPPAGHVRADHFAGNRSADLAVWREVCLLAAYPRAVSLLEWCAPGEISLAISSRERRSASTPNTRATTAAAIIMAAANT